MLQRTSGNTSSYIAGRNTRLKIKSSIIHNTTDSITISFTKQHHSLWGFFFASSCYLPDKPLPTKTLY